MASKSELADLRVRLVALEWFVEQLIFVLAADKIMKTKSLRKWVDRSIERGEECGAFRGREHAAVSRLRNNLVGVPESEQKLISNALPRYPTPSRRRARSNAKGRGGTSRD